MNPNPYQILGLPVAFDIAPADLHKRMIQLVAANHPDRFTDPLDQADAAQRAAAINEAYRLLKEPTSRAAVLLALLGATGQTDEKSLPPNLLMEMMEIREELEEALAGQDKPALARLRQWGTDRKSHLLEALGRLLNQAVDMSATGRQPVLQEAQTHLNTLRYVDRMVQQLPPAED